LTVPRALGLVTTVLAVLVCLLGLAHDSVPP